MPHARRTCRLATAQGQVGVVLGGETGAKLLRHLAMPTSPDTVLRLVRRMPLPEVDVPRIVAVDDWAIRKGRTYGTVVVDLERRRVIDLLPDRTSTAVAEWLRQRPETKVVPSAGIPSGYAGWNLGLLRPRPLYQVCPCRRHWRARGGAGGGSVAPAG